MSPPVDLQIEVQQALVGQSSGRLAQRFGGRLGVDLGLSKALSVGLEVSGAGGGESAGTYATTQLMFRPALLLTGTLGDQRWRLHGGLGPSLTAMVVTWSTPAEDTWVAWQPGGRLRLGVEWLPIEALGVELGLGANLRQGGVDADLGLGVRWHL